MGESVNAFAVRRAVVEDAAAIAVLLEQLGYPSTPEQVGVRLQRMLVQERVAVFVACRAAEVLGVATAHHLSVVNRQRDVAQLTTLVVERNARRLGVGRALVAAVEEYARDADCERLSVTTHLDRNDAHAFYAGIGFEHTGRRYGKTLDG